MADRLSPLARAYAVLCALRGGPLTAAQIADETGIPPSVVHRLLADLVELRAPIARDAVQPPIGRPITMYRLTDAGLLAWISPRSR